MPGVGFEDLADFLDPEEFATVATITLLDDSSRTVAGLFDDPYLNAHTGEFEADSSAPRFTAPEVDLAGVSRGCTVTIPASVVVIGARRVTVPAVTYDVLGGAQPDGTGMATVHMAQQPA